MTAAEVHPVTTRKVLFGTSALIAGRLVGAGLSVVALRLTSTYLGPSQFGAFVSATAVVTLLGTLADLGLVTTAAREVAAAPTADDARHVIGVNLALRVTLALLLIPVAIGLSLVMYPNSADIRTGIGLLAPLLCVTAIQSCAEAVLIGRGRSDLRAITDVLSKGLLLGGVVLVVRQDLGYRAFVIASVAGAGVAALVALGVAARYVRPRLVFGLAPWKATLAIALPLGLVQALNVIYFKIDSLMLSLWRPEAEVGQYGVAYKVIELVMAVPSFFMLTLLPALAIADSERTRHLVQRAVTVLLTLAAPITVIGLLLAPAIIDLVAEREFAPAVTPLRWLLLGAGASYLSAAFGNALVATGRQRDLVRLTVVVVVVNIAVNALLVPQGGASGAAVAVAACEMLSAVMVARVFRRQVGGNASYLFMWKVLASTGLVAASHLVLGSLNVLVEAPLLLAVYASALTVLRGWPRGEDA